MKTSFSFAQTKLQVLKAIIIIQNVSKFEYS